MGITCFLAYITATFIVEACSVANTIESSFEQKQDVFSEEANKTPQMQRRKDDPDLAVKNSKYYIRQKLEIGTIIERIGEPWAKTVFISILIIYVYGALSLKYVAGAESFY